MAKTLINSIAYLIVLLLVSCTSTVARKDVVGSEFPDVLGKSLDGKEMADSRRAKRQENPSFNWIQTEVAIRYRPMADWNRSKGLQDKYL